jgi:hypothetical protein
MHAVDTLFGSGGSVARFFLLRDSVEDRPAASHGCIRWPAVFVGVNSLVT